MHHSEKDRESKTPQPPFPTPGSISAYRYQVLSELLIHRANRLLDAIGRLPEEESTRALTDLIFLAVVELVDAARWCGEMSVIFLGRGGQRLLPAVRS
jgi:hypothetical protein